MAGATALSAAVLAAIANERMRAFRLGAGVLDRRAMAIAGVIATLMRGWLAARGTGGIETSIALAIAAVAAVTDLQCGYVFDRVLLAGGAALAAVAIVDSCLGVDLVGGLVAGVLLLIPWVATRARGIGLGDVKLAAVLGFALGPGGALRTLWIAFVIGALVSAGCIVARRRSRARTVPFAPFLGLGALVGACGGTP